MGWFPKAKRVPTPYGGTVPRNDQDRGILHVAVSGRKSLPPWNVNTWHMYVAKDGSCEQYVDSRFRAFASGDANDDAFSIETEGGLGNDREVNSEPWTPEQCRTLAEIMVWREQEDGTPLEVLPDSKPGRRGWGPHRLGIDPWRVPGGEAWTKHRGKLCPGDAKVAQIPGIVALARQIKAGGTPAPVPSVPIEEDEEDIMFIRNSKGTIVQLTPLWARAIDPATWKGVQAAGHKAVQYSDADFDEMIAAANGLDGAIRHIDKMLGDHVARVQKSLEETP
jgi:hypothetical protein